MSFHIRPATPADGPGIAFVRVTTWRAAYRGIIAQATLDGLDIFAEGVRVSESLAQPWPGSANFVAEVAPVEAPPAGVGDPRFPSPARIAGFARCGPRRAEEAAEGLSRFAPETAAYTGELYALYVLPEYQHLGLGRGLFQAARGWLAEQGHRGMILYALRDNAPARRFYEARGGRLAGERLVDIRGQMLPEVSYGYDLRQAPG